MLSTKVLDEFEVVTPQECGFANSFMFLGAPAWIRISSLSTES
jgi:hypothetical protein